jgi:hypothetical protein
VPGGRISFYLNKSDFEAVCANKAHGCGKRCVVTRRNTAYVVRGGYEGPPVGGRPLGLLVAWLARSEICHTKDLHRAAISDIEESFAVRFNARRSVQTLEGFATLVAFERRDFHDDELPLEPLHVRFPV